MAESSASPGFVPMMDVARKPGRRKGDKDFLYQQVAETLRGHLRGGRFAPGDRLPGNEELAQQFNVNRLTLRRAIVDLIDEGLLVTQPSRGTFVADPAESAPEAKPVARLVTLPSGPSTPAAPGSGPDFAAARPEERSAPPHPSTSLATVALLSDVFLPAKPGAYHLEFLNAIRNELLSIACALVIPPRERIGPPSTSAAVAGIVGHADGLMLLGPCMERLLVELADADRPVVLVDADAGPAPIDSVVVDNHAVGRLAAEHLLAHGHARVAVMTGGMDQPAMRDRLSGFLDGWGAGGGRPGAVTVEDGDFQKHVARQRAYALLEADAALTGIFSFNDDMAAGVLQTLGDLGRADVGVVGCDDVSFASMLHPALTTVRIPRDAMARLAVRCLRGWHAARHDRIPHVRHMVTPELIVRESTTRAKRTNP